MPRPPRQLFNALTLCALSGAMIAPIASAQDNLSSIYRQDIEVTRKGMFFQPGDQVISEIVIIDNGEDGQSDVTMNIASPKGVVCTVEDGTLSAIAPTGFDILAEGLFAGDVCTINVEKNGDRLRITGAKHCSDLCGYGASFLGAKLDRVCTDGLEAASEHLKDKFYVNAENAFTCPAPK